MNLVTKEELARLKAVYRGFSTYRDVDDPPAVVDETDPYFRLICTLEKYMALPKLPTYALTDAINAVGALQPLFSGTAVPLGTIIHAQIIVESYVNENFLIDPTALAAITASAAKLGAPKALPNPEAVKVCQAILAHNQGHGIGTSQLPPVTAFNWLQLLLTIIEAILKALGGLIPVPTP